MSKIECGFIYVASNECFKDKIYNIGSTCGSIENKFHRLSTTGVPTPYKNEFSMFVPFLNEIEDDLRYELSEYRYEDSNVFFKCDLMDICDKLVVVNKYWEEMLDNFKKFFFIGAAYLPYERKKQRYIIPLFKDKKLEEVLDDNGRLYVKNGQVYYAEVYVKLGNVEDIKTTISEINQESK